MPHEFFLTTRQATKIQNAFANNILTDKVLSITQFGGSFDSWLANLGKKALTNLLFLWLEIIFFALRSNLSSNAINELERKVRAKEAVIARKGVTLFI